MIAEPNEEAIPESQVQVLNGEETHRTYSPSENYLLQELLEEMKALHATIKKVYNIEV
jgi:hypothetical protein